MKTVPQKMSLANAMAVLVQYSLYTAAVTPVLRAVFGTSRVLSVANDSEVSLMVGPHLHPDDSQHEGARHCRHSCAPTSSATTS
ncbi:hypothetical protein SDRG_15597 [Saprolegnia diclina VS20]|uniref:SLC26A/SulP transporter domain-containing protein n=2 Tax=Saprolegnia diclina (strain VS20) TaxID=1156394 RepID=T0RAK1_SAPDV|nr:hypothetical protein SDRG_15597 [Saprolegnia diclina VS20]EQC26567.1 hypothetical protein SDRG_15597 [Saprolegnia diclina VS20]|eukprot:XP_008619997.1 hypothetical protein SDRG_15597 [Saprolegnia diclina VS20]